MLGVGGPNLSLWVSPYTIAPLTPQFWGEQEFSLSWFLTREVKAAVESSGDNSGLVEIASDRIFQTGQQ